jgi:hypothetical protein
MCFLRGKNHRLENYLYAVYAWKGPSDSSKDDQVQWPTELIWNKEQSVGRQNNQNQKAITIMYFLLCIKLQSVVEITEPKVL